MSGTVGTGARAPGISAWSRLTLMALIAVLAIGWFASLGYRDLIRPDEGRYAEIAREMVASGDWLTPRLNDFKYFEKPALQYWATAAAFSAFGIHDWTARLWAALTGFAGILLIGYAGLRVFDRETGLYAAAITASSFLYVFIGHANTLDMGLTFFLTAAVCAFALAQHDGQSAPGRRNWMLVAWAAAAFAVLSKGLIGLLLPGGALFLYVVIHRDWRRIPMLHPISGIALFLAISAPWFIAVSMRTPEFFHFFFIQEHFERFLTKEHGRYQPPWYFIPVLLAGLVPWTLSMLPALARSWRADATRFQAARFLLIWSAFTFVFFSASGSKLASYILPVFPALALLTGRYIATASRRAMLWQVLPFGVAGIAIMLLAPAVTKRGNAELPAELLAGYVPWLVLTGLALLAGAALFALLEARGRRPAAVLALAAGGLAAALLPLSGHNALSSVYSSYQIVQKIRPQLRPDTPFYVVNTFDHTLPFYLGRTVTMVSYKDELAIAIGWEPSKFLPDYAAFAGAWKKDRAPFAMFAPDDLVDFQKRFALPMVEVARDPRRVIVTKPPARTP
jgi:4-amino-4-deoxy-L-arabinose transferase-like glycosyltransferase